VSDIAAAPRRGAGRLGPLLPLGLGVTALLAAAGLGLRDTTPPSPAGIPVEAAGVAAPPTDLRARVERAVAASASPWVAVGVDPPRVTLAGELFSEADRLALLERVSAAVGPDVEVVDVLTVLPPIEHVGRALREAGFPIASAGPGRATCTIEGGKGGQLELRAEPGRRVVVEGEVSSERILGKLRSALTAPVDAVTVVDRVRLAPDAA
jgi:hypothetical protein